jgi:calcium-translocating P-type ATPase
MKNWHGLGYEKIAEIFKTSLKEGLSRSEVKKRLTKYGKNMLPERKLPSKLFIFISQFKSPIIYVLIIASIITFFIGDDTDALVIFLAVVVNSVFGFWEENKSLSVMEKLQKVLKTKATVLRNGKKQVILQEEVVPGDILVLQAGDKVAADARLFRSENLKVSEAVITGEWLASDKKIKAIKKDTALAERENMVYAGSLVESGEGRAVIVATGKDTEVGKIAKLVSEAKETPSPLTKKLDKFGKKLTLIIVAGVVLIFLGGLLRGDHPLEIFEAAVAISVGGIPEALPVVMTVILAIGMDRLLRKKGLVRKLSSVETLGSTSVICFDKTKTLTKGEMGVSNVIAKDKKLAMKIAILASEAYIENPGEIPSERIYEGDPTGKALVKFAAENGLKKSSLEKEEKELLRVAFDPNKKYMISLRKAKRNLSLYILGAPENVLAISENKRGWNRKAQKLMDKGLRVVGVAQKGVNIKNPSQAKVKQQENFNFVGLIALKDPLREGINEQIAKCQSAGVKTVIITGDHAKTAKTIALDAGVKLTDKEIFQGKGLDKLSDKEVESLVGKIKLFARAEPRHKIRIIKAWQERGDIVAMAGDGVNDAPAIKQADIGLALGSGTEVAIETADLVLLNDSFEIIVDAIEDGRVVLDNLRKSISYILADSFSSIILIGLANVVFGWPIPILPVQILWNNFVEDTFPDIAYAFEPKEGDVMKRGPNSPKIPLLNKEMKIMIFGTGLIDEFLTFGLFWLLWAKLGLDLNYVRTIIFGAISIDTAFVIYAYKNLRKNIWNLNLFSNKLLNLSSILVIISFSAAVYTPFLQNILHTVPLGITSWGILIAVGITSLFLVEATKWYFISRHETD